MEHDPKAASFDQVLRALIDDKLAEHVDVGYAHHGMPGVVTVTGRVPDTEKRLVVSMQPDNVRLLWRDTIDAPARVYEPESIQPAGIMTATGADLDRASEEFGFGALPDDYPYRAPRQRDETDADFRARVLAVAFPPNAALRDFYAKDKRACLDLPRHWSIAAPPPSDAFTRWATAELAKQKPAPALTDGLRVFSTPHTRATGKVAFELTADGEFLGGWMISRDEARRIAGDLNAAADGCAR
jgi:hypothetical protein